MFEAKMPNPIVIAREIKIFTCKIHEHAESRRYIVDKTGCAMMEVSKSKNRQDKL